ncbi:MAG: hypothetical protein HC918_08790 [Oscillatoriales cyanobacterium SM2_1_8]|nr:hypothetical protein [Oscillatoriales cyanobacterium SM2_1_8]
MRFPGQQWHSGWDGRRFAEVMPARPHGWLVTVLGQGQAAVWLRPLPDDHVLPRCQSVGFVAENATWRSHPAPTFVENPFAVKGAVPHALALAQMGAPWLPVDPAENLPIWLGQEQRPVVRPASQVYVLRTATADLLKLGIARGPATPWQTAQHQSPQPLILWGTFPGTARTLKRLTADFADLTLGNGWFRAIARCWSTWRPNWSKDRHPGQDALP